MSLTRLIATVAALLFAALATLSLFWLSAGGEGAFDGRLTGYSYETAQRYLIALSPVQTNLYLGLFRGLDTVFPAVLTLLLVLIARRSATGAARVALMALAAIYLGADYLENARVAAMIEAGAKGVTPDIVENASRTTIAKWIALAGAVVGLILVRWRSQLNLRQMGHAE